MRASSSWRPARRAPSGGCEATARSTGRRVTRRGIETVTFDAAGLIVQCRGRGPMIDAACHRHPRHRDQCRRAGRDVQRLRAAAREGRSSACAAGSGASPIRRPSWSACSSSCSVHTRAGLDLGHHLLCRRRLRGARARALFLARLLLDRGLRRHHARATSGGCSPASPRPTASSASAGRPPTWWNWCGGRS